MSSALGFGLASLLLLDGGVTLLRAALLNAQRGRLLLRAEGREREVERAVRLLEDTYLRVGLRFALSLLHLTLGWALWQTLFTLNPTSAANLLWVLLAGGLVLALEHALEGAVVAHAESWVLNLYGLYRLLAFLVHPLAALLIALRGGRTALETSPHPVTEDELRAWVKNEDTPGSLEKGEREMIYSIFQFGDTLAREIMVPRIDILALEASTTVEEAIRAFTQSGHSRVPVYEETIDNIIGLLYAKDLLRIQLDAEIPPDIRPFLRPAYFVPESKKVDDLLREMQARSIHMAIVVDEYGGTAGLVTLEDIVEEIIGEIRDEYDQSEELPYQEISPDEYVLHGRLSLDDVNDLLELSLNTDIADTLGGYIYSVVGKVPVGGEQIQVGDWEFIVEQISGRRIRRVRAIRRPRQANTEEDVNEARRHDSPAVSSHSA
ncbi:hemolysin family protein [uncultured Thermanaerothrix sp.]|uniref:hemolysin family protein n=1 Tax=uncultured Thermanaerothrix sp. TaxID=1195149 RepID=UPI002609AB2B|nr:hemolysin family protein [uncultured Thermanaerothrix sp.]